MTDKVVVLFPEDGVKWGLWCNDPPFPEFLDGYFPTPESFRLSQHLTHRLEEWLAEWKLNFNRPQSNEGAFWNPDFDKHKWINEGSEISSELQKETGYTVDRQYLNYLLRPVPLIKRKRSTT